MMGKTHYAFGALFAAAGGPAINDALGLGLSPVELTVGVGVGMVAGVLPDIDHPDSLITKGLLPGRRLFGKISKAVGWWLSIPPRIVGVGARATGNHRGPTHSVTFGVGWTVLAVPLYAAQIAAAAFILSSLMGIISPALIAPITGHSLNFDPDSVVNWLIANAPSVMPLIMMSVFLGYMAHLVSDSMTNVPIPLLWPFSSRRFFFPWPKFMRVTTDSGTEHHLVMPIVVIAATIFYVALIGIPLVSGVVKEGRDVLNKPNGGAGRAPIVSSHHRHHHR
jgi:membrane-bound metal-dependent hydrolase YbcI (DUF457 family)